MQARNDDTGPGSPPEATIHGSIMKTLLFTAIFVVVAAVVWWIYRQ